MEVNFYKYKQIVKSVKEEVTLSEFYELLHKHRPTEFFNTHYSEKTPCWVITEYLNANTVMYYANSWVDKTPRKISIEKLYRTWLYEGLNNIKFYTNIPDTNPDWGQGRRPEQYNYSLKTLTVSIIVLGILIGSFLVYKIISGN